MKIALVHDQLHEFGGAERVFLEFKKIFPNADVFTAYYTLSQLDKFAPDWKSWKIRASWAQKIPFISRLASPLRFLDPWIWESFDFAGYDLVISSSGGHMCKGIITRPETIHISYVHHQPRYLYYYQTAMNWQKYLPIKIYGHFINHFLRLWDYVGSQRPDYLVANSEETRARINKFYRRDATVINPPIEIPSKLQIASSLPAGRQDKLQDKPYYVTVSRLVGSKHIDLMIEASKKGNFKLKIGGTGKDEEYLKSNSNENVEFLGRIDDSEFDELYAQAKGFLFATVDEEFGMVAVEAMARNLPVIAYPSGGVKEIVKDGVNGFFYDKLTVDSMCKAIAKLEALSEKEFIEMKKNARKESEKYSSQEFKKKVLGLVGKCLK